MSDSTGKWLRQVATEIRAQGINGWGNTCEQAADDYDALAARLAEATRLLVAVEQVDHLSELPMDEIRGFIDAARASVTRSGPMSIFLSGLKAR